MKEVEDEDRVGQWHRVCGKIHPLNTECPVNERGPEREMVDHPAHYGGADNPYEHIKVMEASLTPEEFRGAMVFQITKYLHRAGKKDDMAQDIKKAAWYLNRLVQYLDKQKHDHEHAVLSHHRIDGSVRET